MQKIKQLNQLVDQTCSDNHSQAPVSLYKQILNLVESRVDMPKHIIFAISKKLSNKNRKALFICFDLLEYLAYNLELSFFNQIATKEFLFKISGLIMNKQLDPVILDRILKFIRCLDELFRPVEDLVPLFFQFQAGLLRKQYQIPFQYVSPYRPKELKKYKQLEMEKKQQKKRPTVQPTKDQQKTFQEIRMKILVTNQIIDNCNPADSVKGNDLLLEMIQELKQCEKKINETINQNPSESLMQLALASNDDLYITYRRYKDLQRNRKPEQFIFTELASDMIKEKQHEEKKEKPQAYRTEKKVEPQPIQNQQSIFDLLDQPQQPLQPQKKQEQKTQLSSILDNDNETSKASNYPSQQPQMNIFDIMDISQPQEQATQGQQSNLGSLDFLGTGSQNFQQEKVQGDILMELGQGNQEINKVNNFGGFGQQKEIKPQWLSMSGQNKEKQQKEEEKDPIKELTNFTEYFSNQHAK